jgi:DNA polymerase
LDSKQVLEQIAKEVSSCTRCVLSHSRKHAVPGEGPAQADIMLIGEGPGFHENEQGRPFVGAAGRFLEELLAKNNLKRTDVFITNVVKCRPPGNRDPEAGELQACNEYLERQIQAINPKVIVTLGRFSMAKFLPNARISAVHGQATWVRGRLIVPMYHPAAALHQGSLRPVLEKDFSQLLELINKAKEAAKPKEEDKEAPSKEEPKQLSLF